MSGSAGNAEFMTTPMGGLVPAEQIVELGLAAAKSSGISAAVIVHATSQANIRWANNTVTTNGVAQSLSFTVVAVSGRAAGVASGSAADAVDASSIAAVVDAARASAMAAAASGPARDYVDWAAGAVQDDFGAASAETSFDVFGSLIGQLAAAFDGARADERVLYGFARHELETVYLGTSAGARMRWVQPTGTIELNGKSADLSRSSWVGQSTSDFTDVDLAALDAVVTERLGWARRRVDLDPGRYTTVLPPTSVADFMIYLAWSAAGRAAFEGRSAFAGGSGPGGTRLGERLSERAFTLYGDPTEPGRESAPFLATAQSGDELSVFDNGAAASRSELIAGGVINSLLHTRASAAEYGAPFTPPADNLILAGGDETRSTADLVRGVDRGLLVTSLWYIREVDPMSLLLTGLTRDGVFLVERGEVVAAVNNFRFNVSPFDVLRQAGDVGRTERCLSREWSDWFTRTAMPAITVGGFHMSSVSKAQ